MFLCTSLSERCCRSPANPMCCASRFASSSWTRSSGGTVYSLQVRRSTAITANNNNNNRVGCTLPDARPYAPYHCSFFVHFDYYLSFSAAEIVHTFDAFGFDFENEFVCVCRYAGMRTKWYYLENGIFSQFIVLIYVIALWRASTSSATMWSQNAYGASKLNENAFNENETKRSSE